MKSYGKASTNDAFTLIELLIVIGIIGILSGILVMILDVSEYQAQARDARRLNDILSVQASLTNAIANNDIRLTDTTTCIDCNSLTGTLAVDGTGWVKFQNLNGNGLTGFIQALPEDPTNSGDQVFYYYSNGQKYELNVVLESDRYQEMAQKDGGNDDTIYERGFKLDLK